MSGIEVMLVQIGAWAAAERARQSLQVLGRVGSDPGAWAEVKERVVRRMATTVVETEKRMLAAFFDLSCKVVVVDWFEWMV